MMRRDATYGDMRLHSESSVVPIEIKGVTHYPLGEAAAMAGVARQTLSKWAKDGLVPPGQMYSGRYRVFSDEEMVKVMEYAHRLVPPKPRQGSQMNFFTSLESKQGKGRPKT